jgi:hypothetical protein
MIFAGDAKTAIAQATAAFQTAANVSAASATGAPPPPVPTATPAAAAAPLPATIVAPAAPVRPIATADFLTEYKQELLIGGGLLLAGAIGYVAYKKTRR